MWSVTRPFPTPEAGRHMSTIAADAPGFSVTFIVSGDKVRDAD